MRTLIVGDIHIKEEAIPEITSIFENDIFPIKADRFIQLGDWFHFNRPTPTELVYSVKLVAYLKQHYKEVIILSGNGEHDLLHDESTISHLASLGVKTVRGDYIEDNILYGHFMIHESRMAFGTGRMGIKDLAKYQFVFLGHQHSPEVLGAEEAIYHVGSIRHVSFNEVTDRKGVIVLEGEKLTFIPITHCYPMIDVTDVSILSQLNPMTKVRFVVKSFEEYKNLASELNRFGKRFFQFKIKHDYVEYKKLDLMSNKLDSTKTTKSNIIQSYIDKIEDKDVREILDKQFKENT